MLMSSNGTIVRINGPMKQSFKSHGTTRCISSHHIDTASLHCTWLHIVLFNHTPAFYRTCWLTKATELVLKPWRWNRATQISGRISGCILHLEFFLFINICYDKIARVEYRCVIKANMFCWYPNSEVLVLQKIEQIERQIINVILRNWLSYQMMQHISPTCDVLYWRLLWCRSQSKRTKLFQGNLRMKVLVPTPHHTEQTNQGIVRDRSP